MGGAQAKERGLVDAFGGLKDAVADAASRAKLGKADAYRVRYIEKAATPFAQFVSVSPQPRWCLDAVRFGHGADAAGAHDAGSGYAAALCRERGPRKGNGAPVKALAYCSAGSD